MKQLPEELSLDPQLRRPRRARRGSLPGGRGRRGKGLGPRGATLLLANARKRQRSTVKVSYATRGRGARWGAHGAYLAREGAQRQGEKGRGFSADRDDLDLAQTLKGWEAAGDARLFKLVVSPEQAARLDLRAHARALLTGMEQDLGTRLEWVAIDHHNTDHPHLHILVRGRDDQGRPLTLDPTYMMRRDPRPQRDAGHRDAGLAERIGDSRQPGAGDRADPVHRAGPGPPPAGRARPRDLGSGAQG